MSRPARQLHVTPEERNLLEGYIKKRNVSAGMQKRIQIILNCIDNWKIADIAKANNVSQTSVVRWKNRYLESGISGLKDLQRSGRPTIYNNEFQNVILSKLEETPPEGYSQWDGVLLAQQTGYSKHAIWRFLRSRQICLARKRSWCISTDPEFGSKAADVIGLYLAPPENAIIISVDEKPNIQALERSTGYVISSDKKVVRGLQSTYKRHGTLNLFAALDVATGNIQAKTTEPSEKTKKGFLVFLEDVVKDLPEETECHVIMDNHSIHKRHEHWLEQHPNIFFHYTPTSASWLNMVEIWFGILTFKSLRGASHANTQEMAEHIKAFVEAYNKTAKPFVWRKRTVKGAQLANSIRNFCN